MGQVYWSGPFDATAHADNPDPGTWLNYWALSESVYNIGIFDGGVDPMYADPLILDGTTYGPRTGAAWKAIGEDLHAMGAVAYGNSGAPEGAGVFLAKAVTVNWGLPGDTHTATSFLFFGNDFPPTIHPRGAGGDASGGGPVAGSAPGEQDGGTGTSSDPGPGDNRNDPAPNPPSAGPGVAIPGPGGFPPLDVDLSPGVSLGDAFDDFPDGDIIEIPIDDSQNTGQLVTWQPVYAPGIDRPNAIFAWDTPPRNLKSIGLLDNGQETVNEIYATGAVVDGVTLTVTVVDQESIDAIGRYFGTVNFSFATTIETLTLMAQSRLRKNRMGQHVVSFDPQPGAPSLPRPWAEFDKSDTVRVRTSWHLRNGFPRNITGAFGHTLDVHRVNGWDLDLDNDTNAELLVKLYTEEDLG